MAQITELAEFKKLPPTPLFTLTRGISVRAHQLEDLEVQAKRANNITIAWNMSNSFPHPYTIEHAKRWFSTVNEDMVEVRPGMSPYGDELTVPSKWAIAKGGEYIGGIGLKFLTGFQYRTAELGYWIAEDFWNQGIGTEVVKAMIGWTWDAFPHIYRLEGCVFGWNTSSGKLLEKCGFRKEAVLKETVCKEVGGKQALTDTIVYVILRRHRFGTA